jgi:PEP-CTERM motif
MKLRFLVMATVTLAITPACPAAADTDASILNDTFFGIGGPPSDYAFNNQSPGGWSVATSSSDFEYVYNGQPFTTNLILGATNISVDFLSSALLMPATNYDVSSPIFDAMTISDGVNTIAAGGGAFLGSSHIQTDNSGNIASWVIAELLGTGRTFVLGDQCCTIGDPPFLYTYGSKSVPEPSTWVMMLVGFAGLCFAAYRRARERTTVWGAC